MRRAPLVAAPTFQSRQKIMRGMWRRLPSTWRNNWGGWVRSVRQKFSTLRHSPSDQGARQALTPATLLGQSSRTAGRPSAHAMPRCGRANRV